MADDEFVACETHLIVEAGEYSAVQWSPCPEGTKPTTQVHLILSLADIVSGAALVLRLRSRESCQELIDMLILQRDGVWPRH